MLPLSAPIRGRDGKMMDSIFVPKDTSVGIGILSANRSKAIWGEDADNFNPMRFIKGSIEHDAKVGMYSNL